MTYEALLGLNDAGQVWKWEVSGQNWTNTEAPAARQIVASP